MYISHLSRDSVAVNYTRSPGGVAAPRRTDAAGLLVKTHFPVRIEPNVARNRINDSYLPSSAANMRSLVEIHPSAHIWLAVLPFASHLASRPQTSKSVDR